uniref:Uncharacterized protein n=1 Tax=Tanacetum cinerariifolium TaxID=118510 RepID=A0A699W956_TANCI|nr:hypothetical protein [Tanacetum cinerariifolium]
MFRPTTLAEFYGLCKLEEAILNVAKKAKDSTISNPNFQHSFPNTRPKPFALTAANANWRNKAYTSQNTPFRKHLTQKELEEKKEKNQCR